MIKRVLSLFIAVLMLLALVACGGTENDPASTGPSGGTDVSVGPGTGTGSVTGTDTGKPPEEKPLPEPNYEEFAGKNYVVIQHQTALDPFGYTQDSLVAEMALTRIDEIQNQFGCTLTLDQLAYTNDFASELQGRAYSENGGDLIFATNNAQLRKALGRGGEESVLVDLLALDDIIDFWNFEKWGNITARETMMAGGIFYGVTPALWYEYAPLPYYNLVYNKTLRETLGVTDPQEYWEKEEWDRDTMLDLITSCYDDTGAEPVWGISATMSHMVRATYLSAGVPAVVVDKINADGTVDWTYGMTDPDALEALQWLKNSINTNRKYFNNGKGSPDVAVWGAHNTFLNGQALFCLTAPSVIFNNISLQMDSFGLIPWAGADVNTMTGYYENCASVGIPIFAQDYYQSAYLMTYLFEGLNDVESGEDVVKYYRETYFDSDLDVKFLLMDGASLQYSYWPNGGDGALGTISDGLLTASSVKTLVENNVGITFDCVENYIVPNTVKLEQYRQNGFFN